MLRNSKPIITELNEVQFEMLKNRGFLAERIGGDEQIKIDDKAFYKPYTCCGGLFRLYINLYHYYWGDKEINPSVHIKTPYDRWWCSQWTLADFTKDMEKFQKELEADIKNLRKLGIIS